MPLHATYLDIKNNGYPKVAVMEKAYMLIPPIIML